MTQRASADYPDTDIHFALGLAFIDNQMSQVQSYHIDFGHQFSKQN